MAKFDKERFPPQFFDITQDLRVALPADLIGEWARSDQTPQTALALLEPHKVRGYLLCSDAAGLTRLGAGRSLIEILALINHPKELIHALGTGIGGESVGIWAADNSEMFFPESVDGCEILSMLLALQERIRVECDVRVGAALHFGEFFHLGGGMYGTDADEIEHLAESHASGGQTLVTAAALDRIGAGPFSTAAREDLTCAGARVFRLFDGPTPREPRLGTLFYPIPFSEEFYQGLCNAGTDSNALESLRARYARQLAVALIERESEAVASREVSLLNDLALSLVMKRVASDLLARTGGKEIKTAGAVGIYTFPECREAFDFAVRFRRIFGSGNIGCRCGIDFGEVLVFDIAEGLHDIAGMPVNVASKMAQDAGSFGNIYLTEEVSSRIGRPKGFRDVTFSISGIDLAVLQG